MAKHSHEIRDPIHGFIRLSTAERNVLDSRPFQRLRHIHQLAMTYLVYPGATHRRFEHSIGVMEIAGRIFDVVTREPNIHHDAVRQALPDPKELETWRATLRMAALCHDIGHLPFSHAGEDLLPGGQKHEALTVALIHSDEMQEIWRSMRLIPAVNDVAKLAVGKKELPDEHFSDWEALLSEIIIGAAFGADRMDYLLRDSYHAGVKYGMFDIDRLIDSLRILPERGDQPYSRPVLGVDIGGLHSAEAVLLARYFMFMQVYFHPIRRIYDIHLRDFLKAALPNGRYSMDPLEHLKTTDNEILTRLRDAAWQPDAPGHEPATRIMGRRHFRLLYRRTPGDPITMAQVILREAGARFGESSVRRDYAPPRSDPYDFPVLLEDGRVESALARSELLKKTPPASVECVFVVPEQSDVAKRWFEQERERLLSASTPEEEQ